MKKLFHHVWRFIQFLACYGIFFMVLDGLSNSKFYTNLYKCPVLWYIGYGLNILAAFLVAYGTFQYYYKDKK